MNREVGILSKIYKWYMIKEVNCAPATTLVRTRNVCIFAQYFVVMLFCLWTLKWKEQYRYYSSSCQSHFYSVLHTFCKKKVWANFFSTVDFLVNQKISSIRNNFCTVAKDRKNDNFSLQRTKNSMMYSDA